VNTKKYIYTYVSLDLYLKARSFHSNISRSLLCKKELQMETWKLKRGKQQMDRFPTGLGLRKKDGSITI